MIHRYKDIYIDFENVEMMELKSYITEDNDEALRLIIHFRSRDKQEINARVKYEYDPITQITKKSEYPLERLRKIANTWMRHKNEGRLVVAREIVKQGDKEIITENITNEG